MKSHFCVMTSQFATRCPPNYIQYGFRNIEISKNIGLKIKVLDSICSSLIQLLTPAYCLLMSKLECTLQHVSQIEIANYPKRRPPWMAIIYSSIRCKHYSRHRTSIFYCKGSHAILKKYLLTGLHVQGEPPTNPEAVLAFIFLINLGASPYKPK